MTFELKGSEAIHCLEQSAKVLGSRRICTSIEPIVLYTEMLCTGVLSEQRQPQTVLPDRRTIGPVITGITEGRPDPSAAPVWVNTHPPGPPLPGLAGPHHSRSLCAGGKQ